MHIFKRLNYVKRDPFLVPLLSHMSAVHCIMPSYFFQICFNVSPESHRPFNWSIPFRFSYHKSIWFCLLPCVLCVLPISSFIWHILLFCEELMFCHKKIENTVTAQKLKRRQTVFLMWAWSNKVSLLRTTADVLWQFDLCGLFTPNFIFRLWILWHVAWFRFLVAGLPLQRSGSDPRPFHVGFVVNRVALGHTFSKYISFPLSISFC